MKILGTVLARVKSKCCVFGMLSLLIWAGCALDPSGVTDSGKEGVDPSMPFECSGALLARYPEACNGMDDDCDGEIDEGLGACPVDESELPFRLCSRIAASLTWHVRADKSATSSGSKVDVTSHVKMENSGCVHLDVNRSFKNVSGDCGRLANQ